MGGQFDLTLTDIPYGEVNRSSNGLRNLDKEDADILTFNLQDFLKEIYEVTKSTIIIFCGKKQNSVTDYLHKITRYFAKYCREQGITCVVAGDIRNIRKGKDLGHRTNQKFHNLPYNRLYSMMEYKLKMYGIRFVRQEESYTSQCSPLSPEVEKRYAQPCNRKQRGLYRDRNRKYNADAVGAYNILRKYLSVSGEKKELSVTGLKTPEIIKVAV